MIKSTIMIPAYNVGRFLPQTLESVFNQINNDTEVLLVNDGSTDDTLEIARRYERLYPQMRVLNQKNQGIGPTRNRLLKESKGEILFGLDADDLLKSKALELVLKEFQKEQKIGFVYSDHEEIDEDGRKLRDVVKADCHKFFDDLIYHCHFLGHLRVFRKSSLRGARFSPSLKTAEDWDFLLQLVPYVQKSHIPISLYSYRRNRQGLTKSQPQNMFKKALELSRYYTIKNNIYGGKDFKTILVNIRDDVVYFDHFIDRTSTMKPEARKVLEEFLRQ